MSFSNWFEILSVKSTWREESQILRFFPFLFPSKPVLYLLIRLITLNVLGVRYPDLSKTSFSGYKEVTILCFATVSLVLYEKNVVVLDNKSDIIRAESSEFWHHINEEKLEYLNQTIAPIMRCISSVDFQAMRFEKDAVEYSIALLKLEEKDLENVKEILSTQIAELPLSIGVVAKEKTIITLPIWVTPEPRISLVNFASSNNA
jgi:hypothetical protein